MKLTALVLVLICIAASAFGQPMSKEAFLNEVINDFVDSTFPVFYMKREAEPLKCNKFCFNTLKKRISIATTSNERTLCDTMKFFKTEATSWKIDFIRRARTPYSKEEENKILSQGDGIYWSKDYAYRESGDGRMQSEGFIVWPAEDDIRNQKWGRTLYQFSTPLFDSSKQYALIACMPTRAGVWTCAGFVQAVTNYYLYQKIDGHWKKRYHFN